MELSKANIDGLTSDHEEADLRMFTHVSHAMELYSPLGVVIWNIVKLTLTAEGDSRMFAHVWHSMKLYSPGAVAIWNIIKLT